MVALAAMVSLAACSGAKTQDNAEGDSEVIKAGDLGAFDVKPGNCLVTTTLSDVTEISSVPAVPCTDPHDAEVTATVSTSELSYDEDKILIDAEQKCEDALEAYIGVPWSATTLETWYLTPSSDSWKTGDREIACMAWDETGSNLTASVKGKGAEYPLPDGVAKKSYDTIAAGDCLNSADQSDQSFAYFVTACENPHDLEVVGRTESAEVAYSSAVDTESETFCRQAFADYVGLDYDESSLDMYPSTPDETTWALGDRAIVCFAGTEEPTLTTSVAGTAQ